jgi:hypothetical protein
MFPSSGDGRETRVLFGTLERSNLASITGQPPSYNRMSPRDVAGKCALKYCAEAYTKWNYNAVGSDNFLHKSNQQTKSQTPTYRN